MSTDDTDTTQTAETRYTFVPSVRLGYSPSQSFDAKIFKNGSEGIPDPSRTSVQLKTTGTTEGGGSGTETRDVSLRIYGPGDVTGLDHRQVVRVDPKPDTEDVPPNYFPLIEFDRPDIPWLFSPTRADDQGRNMPWCCLVAVELDREDVVFEPRGVGPLPTLSAPVAELPDLTEAWAWAHAQVTTEPSAGSEPVTDEERFSPESLVNISRLLCPRNLRVNKRYLAAVVPTFAPGRSAGLGDTPSVDDGTISLAWSEAMDTVRLPVYYWWEFSTGAEGDFESLVRELEPRDLGPEVGSLTVDVSNPGPTPLLLTMPTTDEWTSMTDAQKRAALKAVTVGMGGALRSPDLAPDANSYEADARKTLRDILDFPEHVRLSDGESEDSSGEEYGIVGPPLYGKWYAGVSRLQPIDGSVPAWFETVNTDPRHRIAAGFGTEIIHDRQESLMHSAWEQFGQIREANDLFNNLRLSERALRRPYERLEELGEQNLGRLFRFSAPMHSHVFDPERGQTLFGHISQSDLPDPLVSTPFRRLIRPTGPLARRSGVNISSERLDRGFQNADIPRVSGEGMFIDGRPDPHGVGERDTFEAFDPERELGELWGDQSVSLDRANATITGVRSHYLRADNHLAALERAVAEGNQTRVMALSSVDGLGARVAGIEGDTVGALAETLSELEENDRTVPFGDDADVARHHLDRLDTNRLALATQVETVVEELRGGEYDPERASNELREAQILLSEVISHVDGVQTNVDPRFTTPVSPDAVLGDRIEEGRRETVDPDRIPAGGFGVDIPKKPTPEELIDRLITELDPRERLPQFGADRIGIDRGLADREDPLNPIMAGPTFDDPMYEALVELNQEYLLPGVGEIPSNTVGAVETNPPFVEAFMLGLNHEMARELRWRQYPTDRRWTYFDIFWDRRGNPETEGTERERLPGVLTRSDLGRPDLPADIEAIHTWGDTVLGENASAEVGEQQSSEDADVVLLIRGELLRRYPNTTIYAAKAKSKRKDEERKRVPILPNPDDSTDESSEYVRYPSFRGRLDPDITFFGFDLTTTDAVSESYPSDDTDLSEDDGAGRGWFFVLEEPPGEARFGFDEAEADAEQSGDERTTDEGTESTEAKPPYGVLYDKEGRMTGEVEYMSDEERSKGVQPGWNAMTWDDLGKDGGAREGDYVSVGQSVPGNQKWRIDGSNPVWYNPPSDSDDESETFDETEYARWGHNSADMARITWQRPVRVAIHADDLLPPKQRETAHGADTGDEGLMSTITTDVISDILVGTGGTVIDTRKTEFVLAEPNLDELNLDLRNDEEENR